MEIKLAAKIRLAKYIKDTTQIAVNPHSLFDIQVKRIHEYKRQQMNIFGVIYRYLKLKSMTPEELKKQVPRASIFGGKAAPGYWMVRILRSQISKFWTNGIGENNHSSYHCRWRMREY